jgi:hypothetical protein
VQDDGQACYQCNTPITARGDYTASSGIKLVS